MEKEIQRRSLDRFFRKEYQKLVQFTRKNLDERFFGASPEDIVQDVMLSLMYRLDLDAQISNLASYVYRSVRNRISDARGRKQRNVSLENLSEEGKERKLLNSLSGDSAPEGKPYQDITPEQLQEAISRLRPDEQALILATEFTDQTYEELSEEWDVPLGTLLSRKHRALSKLYRILSNLNT